MPLKVSETLLSQESQRLLQMDHDRACEVPVSLAGFQIVIFDGKAIKKVRKRLKALWGWTIERVFQQVTEVFHLRKLIGSSPKATVFQFGFCLLLYNMIQVVRSYVAQSQALSVDGVSTEKLFEDVTDELVAYSKISGSSEPNKLIPQKQTARQLRAYLSRRLRRVWRPRWTKNTRKQPQAASAKSQAKRRRTHGSVYRIMEDYRLAQQKSNARRQRC